MIGSDKLSINIPLGFLLLIVACLSIVNLIIFMSDSKLVDNKSLGQDFLKLSNRVTELEEIIQNISFDTKISPEQLAFSDSEKLAELDDRINDLTQEIENIKSLDNSVEGLSESLTRSASEGVYYSVKQGFEDESDLADSHHDLLLVQSSIKDSLYQAQLENVELVNVVCRSRSCRVDLSLMESTNPEIVLDEIINNIDQDVDYQINKNDSEMNIYITLSGERQ